MLKLSDFDYFLPAHLIAQHPSSRRDRSRLCVLDRQKKSIAHKRFCDVLDFFLPGDLLVLNDTKVVRARLWGRRATGGRVEVFLLEPCGEERYRALIKPLGRLREQETIFFEKGFSCRLVDPKKKIVAFDPPGAKAAMAKAGVLPLPPYIRRSPSRSDKSRYQTVFAAKEGAVAAPTAGLHFTRNLLARIARKGVGVHFLTLHVNYATFSPVRSDDIREHRMETEYFEIPASTVAAIRKTREQGGRIFSVGTTVCKALEESASDLFQKGDPGPLNKGSRLFIYPPYSFKVTDALITNFHLPRTTLLMLVAAFAGKSFMLEAYATARRHDYRFYSYGDAMLIL
jgi:S-adenosylmethionine:tRNA ribosyltransferase-isomerase